MDETQAILKAISEKYISIHLIDLYHDTQRMVKTNPSIENLAEGIQSVQEPSFMFWHI